MRVVWQTFGWVNVGFGALGLILPLLPTTPFLLVAAWAFARSSPRFHHWLITHPKLGQPILDWREARAIRPQVKLLAVTVLAAGFLIAVVAGLPAWALMSYGAILSGVALFIVTRCSPD